ncbi:AbrB/MazE/SpoVT family DNA-binding domain-containing protein [Nocardioides sp. AE5]|uniref:AbrB/MazE/SpoVT family DNA-binding domain-containing protein n=1 Tax=Nocardioides sp. AE5 TaxID=2962573 RepID=UPI0037CC03AA
MNLAKLSANGQITVPVEVRRRLRLVPGDKVLFVEKPNGEVVVANAAVGVGRCTECVRWCCWRFWRGRRGGRAGVGR